MLGWGLEEDKEENGANMIEDFLSSTDINAEEMIGGPSEELEGFLDYTVVDWS